MAIIMMICARASNDAVAGVLKTIALGEYNISLTPEATRARIACSDRF